MSMKTYEIDVNAVDAGSGKGKALARPRDLEVQSSARRSDAGDRFRLAGGDRLRSDDDSGSHSAGHLRDQASFHRQTGREDLRELHDLHVIRFGQGLDASG